MGASVVWRQIKLRGSVKAASLTPVRCKLPLCIVHALVWASAGATGSAPGTPPIAMAKEKITAL
jgi:hypothetical protein